MTALETLLITLLIIQAVTSLPTRQLPENGVVDLYVMYKGVFIVQFPSQFSNCDEDIAIPFRNCSPREVIDCRHYQELGTLPRKQVTSTTEFRKTNKAMFEVKEHLEGRNYTLQIHGINERIRLFAFHSQDSEIHEWALALELHSRSGRTIILPLKDIPELKMLFNFKHFHTTLKDHSHGYHGNNNSFIFNWDHAKLGVHTLPETSLSCMCISPGRTEEVPCDTRLESTTSVGSRLPQNVVIIAWIVASVSVILQHYLLW